jgi:hypothetical protein
MLEPARNDDGLPRLYGYAALERIYGWKRRTLENAVNAGKLRKPFYVGKAACWYAKDIDDYLARLRGDLDELAVSTPDKITPEAIETAVGSLVERWAGQHGLELPPGSFVSINSPPTTDQRAAVQRTATEERERSANELADAFARLDPVRGWLVVGGLIPALRPAADRFLENLAGVSPSETQEELRALAIDILDQAVEGKFVGPAKGRHVNEGIAS